MTTPKNGPSKSKSNEKVLRSPPVSPASAEENNVNPPLRILSNSTNFHSLMNAKQSQRNSPFSTPRPLKSDTNKYHDEEDNWSMASSAATSQTVKSLVTVGVAPNVKSCIQSWSKSTGLLRQKRWSMRQGPRSKTKL